VGPGGEAEEVCGGEGGAEGEALCGPVELVAQAQVKGWLDHVGLLSGMGRA
jgi:hypothetical protein